MNQHNPPSPAEVRAKLWNINQRLRERLDDAMKHMESIIEAYDEADTKQLAAAVTAAEKYLEEKSCSPS